jgi:hypothetical protein
MMHQMFPHALVACISQGRVPERDEVQDMTDKVFREAFSGGGDDYIRLAHLVASTALLGQRIAA